MVRIHNPPHKSCTMLGQHRTNATEELAGGLHKYLCQSSQNQWQTGKYQRTERELMTTTFKKKGEDLPRKLQACLPLTPCTSNYGDRVFFIFDVFYSRRYIQSTFFTFRRFVPVDVFPFDVLSHSAFFPFHLSHSAFFLSTFRTSTLFTVGVFYFDVLSVNPPEDESPSK
jgi:hypothetical protein